MLLLLLLLLLLLIHLCFYVAAELLIHCRRTAPKWHRRCRADTLPPRCS